MVDLPCHFDDQWMGKSTIKQRKSTIKQWITNQWMGNSEEAFQVHRSRMIKMCFVGVL